MPIIGYNVIDELLQTFDLSDTDTVTDAKFSLLLGSFPETSLSNIKASVNLIQENTSADLSSVKSRKIKAVLGMLARGTEQRKYGPMAEEAGSACDCKTFARNGSFESIATQKIGTVNYSIK